MYSGFQSQFGNGSSLSSGFLQGYFFFLSFLKPAYSCLFDSSWFFSLVFQFKQKLNDLILFGQSFPPTLNYHDSSFHLHPLFIYSPCWSHITPLRHCHSYKVHVSLCAASLGRGNIKMCSRSRDTNGMERIHGSTQLPSQSLFLRKMDVN